MSEIRKKSLKASAWVYAGFIIGAANTYFFTHKEWFTPDQYGLTRVMLDISMLVFALSTLGSTNFLYKFFPYYEDNLDSKINDVLGLALMVSLLGFFVTMSGAWLFEALIIRKFSANSAMLIQYFYWILPLSFFILLYHLLEAFSYGFHKGVLTSFLKETVLRLYVFGIVIAKVFNWIDFESFIILFSFQYAIVTIILASLLFRENKLWITFRFSRVSKKFGYKIVSIMAFTFLVIVVGVLRQSIDGLVLAAKQNLGKVGIFGMATYMVSLLQAPLRSLIAITIPLLSRAWKEKNYTEISRIYKRSSINMLTFSLLVFFCIWLNFTEIILYLGIHSDYLEGKWVFFLLGMVTIIEMGTGVNGQIIATSNYWRFELWTSLVLTMLIIPLSYSLTVRYGILGPAISNVISFSIYNGIRIQFLWNKFHMQPFSIKSLEAIIIAIVFYIVVYLFFENMTGLSGLVVRTLVFTTLFFGAVIWRKITPDLQPILFSVFKRIVNLKI